MYVASERARKRSLGGQQREMNGWWKLPGCLDKMIPFCMTVSQM